MKLISVVCALAIAVNAAPAAPLELRAKHKYAPALRARVRQLAAAALQPAGGGATPRRLRAAKAARRELSELRRLQSITISNSKDVFYLGYVKLGDPEDSPQSIEVVFDTGSSDLWVVGQSCSVEPSSPKVSQCAGTTRFDPSSSSTYDFYPDTSWTDDYGSGEVKGAAHQESVTLPVDGGNGDGVCTITDQTFGIATSMAPSQAMLPDSGILGLAFPGLAKFTNPTIFERMSSSCDLPQVFMWYLTKEPDASGSTLTLGGVDTQQPGVEGTSGFTMIDLVQWPTQEGPQYLWWTTKLAGVAVGSSGCALSLGCGTSCTAIVDSGTSGIAVSNWAVVASQILTASGYSFTPLDPTSTEIEPNSCVIDSADEVLLCYQVDPTKFPDLHFLLGSSNSATSVSIPGEAYVVPVEDQAGFFTVTLQDSGGGDGSSPDVIMGDTLMKEFYTYFDMENKQVGFQAIPGGMPVDTGPAQTSSTCASGGGGGGGGSNSTGEVTISFYDDSDCSSDSIFKDTIGASCAPFGPPGAGFSGKFQGSCEAGTLTLYQTSDCTGQSSSQSGSELRFGQCQSLPGGDDDDSGSGHGSIMITCKTEGGGSHVAEYVGIAAGIAVVAFLVYRVTRRRTRIGGRDSRREPLVNDAAQRMPITNPAAPVLAQPTNGLCTLKSSNPTKYAIGQKVYNLGTDKNLSGTVVEIDRNAGEIKLRLDPG